MMKVKVTFGKLNEDGSKAVNLINQDGQRMFAFWLYPHSDVQNNETPTKAVERIIINAGYDSISDYFTTKFYLAK